MHIYFSGIGGAGIGPLALIAKAAGYDVSGSDMQHSQYIDYLAKHGVTDVHIGQSEQAIEAIHKHKPIDWLVHTSSLLRQDPHHPEYTFCLSNNVKISLRDELLNKIIDEKQLKLLAIAGTHGKSTTTAMVIWLFKQLDIPVSYSVGAKTSFAEMGDYEAGSAYFVYECDEYDRNFLAFHPFISVITGVAWDHHDIYPTEQEYMQAFSQFVHQSQKTFLYLEDDCALHTAADDSIEILHKDEAMRGDITLTGAHNKQNAWLAVQCIQAVSGRPSSELVALINTFPGLSRRFEYIQPNLVTDYAHTPEKIAGCIQLATEVAQKNNQDVVVVYEPLTNTRIYHTIEKHTHLFDDISKLYWVPSYLAREDPSMEVLSPEKLVAKLSPKSQAHAIAKTFDSDLKETIKKHLTEGALVVCLSGGGGNSLDEWLRKNFS